VVVAEAVDIVGEDTITAGGFDDGAALDVDVETALDAARPRCCSTSLSSSLNWPEGSTVDTNIPLSRSRSLAWMDG